MHRLSCEKYSESGSVLFAVTDGAGRVVGTATLVPGTRWTLTSLTIEPTGDGIVAAALCHGIVQMLRVNRARAITVTVDDRGRALLASLGLLPVTDSVADLLDHQRRLNPEGYWLVTQGAGLGNVALPYAGELLIAPADAEPELAAIG
jgi:hypothetical protein